MALRTLRRVQTNVTTMADNGELEVADDELRLLEAMAAVSQSMQQLNQVLVKLNRQTVDLSTELRTAERQMNALYLPFQAAIYELQSANKSNSSTTPAANRAAHGNQ